MLRNVKTKLVFSCFLFLKPQKRIILKWRPCLVLKICVFLLLKKNSCIEQQKSVEPTCLSAWVRYNGNNTKISQ